VTRFGRAGRDADASSDGSPRSRQCSPPIAAVPLTPVHVYCAPRDSPPILPAKELRSSPGSAIFSRYDVNALTPKVMAQSPSSAQGVSRGMDRETPGAPVKPRAPSPPRVGPRRRAPGRRHTAICNAFLPPWWRKARMGEGSGPQAMRITYLPCSRKRGGTDVAC
jgi:hypothetical protein